MTLDLGSILAILGAVVGISLYAFGKVSRSPVGARRENKIKVDGQRKVEAIEKTASEARKRVQDELAESRGEDPSDVIGKLIREGEVSK